MNEEIDNRADKRAGSGENANLVELLDEKLEKLASVRRMLTEIENGTVGFWGAAAGHKPVQLDPQNLRPLENKSAILTRKSNANNEKGQSPPFNPADEETKNGGDDIDPSLGATATAYNPVGFKLALPTEGSRTRNRQGYVPNNDGSKYPENPSSDALVKNFIFICNEFCKSLLFLCLTIMLWLQ